MPRKAQWPPRIRTNRNSDRVRWQGVDYYLGPTGSQESKRAYAELLARLSAGQEVASPPPVTPHSETTVKDVISSWLTEVAPRYSQRGREVAQFKRSVLPLLALYGTSPAAAFDADALETVQVAMATGSWKKGQTGWCRNVVNRRVVRIRTIWRWAERKKLVPAGSWANLRTVAGLAPHDTRVRQTARRKPVAFERVKAVVRHAPPAVKAMLLLMWWSGLRPGEVRIMRKCDVDVTGPEWTYRPSQHKNDWRGQERVVVLGPRARAALRPWLLKATSQEAFLFPPARQRKHPHYSCTGLSQVVRRSAEKAGEPGVIAYLMRHSCKQRVTREEGLDAARSVLGQKSLSSTDGYGLAADLELARRAARKLG